MKFRKKPVVIEAIEWNGDNIPEVRQFMAPVEPVYMAEFADRDEIVGIETLEGLMVAKKGDFIIRGVKGELYPCKPDVFAATYAPDSADDDPLSLLGRCLGFLMAQRRGVGCDKPSVLEDDVKNYLDRMRSPAPTRGSGGVPTSVTGDPID